MTITENQIRIARIVIQWFTHYATAAKVASITWHAAYFCFFTFYNVLLKRSNCFRIVERYVVHMLFTSQIWYCIISVYGIIDQIGQNTFLYILSLPSLTFFINRQCCQYRLPNIVATWAKLLGPPFSIQITQFCGILSKIIGQASKPRSSFLKKWNGNFVCDFSGKYGGEI